MIPHTSIQVLGQNGSLHETESERGLAHVLEHMVFKGTESLEPNLEMALKIKLGGDVNAYTTFDRTVLICKYIWILATSGVLFLLSRLF